MTTAEIHRTIITALMLSARECRKLASGRKMAGQVNENARAALRAEAQRCDDLQRVLANVSPEALAKVLETER